MVQFTLTLFEYVPPIENIPADAIVITAFIICAVCFAIATAYYVRMFTRTKEFVYMFKPAYAILLTVSEIFSMLSIYIVYGFMAQTFTDAMLQEDCSLWTYWTMFILGLGLWIAILVNTVGNTALSILAGRFSQKMLLSARLLLMFICLVVYVIVGVIGELMHMFREDGVCTTHFSFKLVNIAIVLAFLGLITSAGKWLETHPYINTDDKRGLLIEMKIVTHTWILFGVLIFLNIFGLTAYWPGRMLFAIVVIYIFSYTHLVYIITPIAHRHNFRYLNWLPQIFTIRAYQGLATDESSAELNGVTDGVDAELATPSHTKDMYLSNDQLALSFLTSIFKLSEEEKLNPRTERAYAITIPGTNGDYKFLANELIGFITALKTLVDKTRLDPESDDEKSVHMLLIDELFLLKEYTNIIDQYPMMNLYQLPIVASFIGNKHRAPSELMDVRHYYLTTCTEIYNFLRNRLIDGLFEIWVESGACDEHVEYQQRISEHNLTLAESSNHFL